MGVGFFRQMNFGLMLVSCVLATVAPTMAQADDPVLTKREALVEMSRLADIVKGYEVDKDQYVLLEPEEIDAIKLESKRTIDLVQFVDAKDIDYRYFERPC